MWVGKLPKKEDVIRIDTLERPTTGEPGDGLFEWAYMKDRFTVDYPLLLKEIEKVFPGHSESVATRLMNFPRVFIILSTGEVISDTITE